jgi:hypothetical protein
MSWALLALLIVLFLPHRPTASDTDIETIRQRVLDRMHDRSVDEENVHQLMNDMTPDGCWSDVDYSARGPTAWDPIRHRGLVLTMMAFYEAGRSTIDAQRTLSVDMPCLVLVKRHENGYAVSVANPDGDAARVHVRIHSKQAKDVIGEQAFDLPGGQQGGRTVTHTIKGK